MVDIHLPEIDKRTRGYKLFTSIFFHCAGKLHDSKHVQYM